MKNKRFLTGPAVLLFVLLFAGLFLSACAGLPESKKEDNRTDKINLTDIPLTVNGQPAYKVYVYASNSISQRDRHEAQGTAELNGAASITVPLYTAPEDFRGKDPDDYGEAWLGRADYFTVIISPKNAPNKEAILVRAGQKLNRANQNWSLKELIYVSESSLLSSIAETVYNDIVRKDNQGFGTDIIVP